RWPQVIRAEDLAQAERVVHRLGIREAQHRDGIAPRANDAQLLRAELLSARHYPAGRHDICEGAEALGAPLRTTRAGATARGPARMGRIAKQDGRAYQYNQQPHRSGLPTVMPSLANSSGASLADHTRYADVLIRSETSTDEAVVRLVEERAFARREEAALVDALRAHDRITLSLVA